MTELGRSYDFLFPFTHLFLHTPLIAEGFDQHIPKGYIYFSMAFSLFVEMLNLKTRGKKSTPIKLRTSLTSN
jgi:predicted tellurium resistance membrane protein TerC